MGLCGSSAAEAPEEVATPPPAQKPAARTQPKRTEPVPAKTQSSVKPQPSKEQKQPKQDTSHPPAVQRKADPEPKPEPAVKSAAKTSETVQVDQVEISPKPIRKSSTADKRESLKVIFNSPRVGDVSEDERREMEETWEAIEAMDENGHLLGYVSVDEFKDLLPTINDDLDAALIERMFKDVDTSSGRITKDAYMQFMHDHSIFKSSSSPAPSPETLLHPPRGRHKRGLTQTEMEHATPDTLAILKVMDPDNKGVVDAGDILDVIKDVNDKLTDSQVEALLTEADPEQTGEIRRYEFLRMMRKAISDNPVTDEVEQFVPRFTNRHQQAMA